jgi:hypothetical protein
MTEESHSKPHVKIWGFLLFVFIFVKFAINGKFRYNQEDYIFFLKSMSTLTTKENLETVSASDQIEANAEFLQRFVDAQHDTNPDDFKVFVDEVLKTREEVTVPSGILGKLKKFKASNVGKTIKGADIDKISNFELVGETLRVA